MKGNLRAYLELTVAMVLAGSSVVVGKLMAASLPVFLAGGLSSAIGAAILVPVLLRREGGLPAVSRRDLLILFLQALTGIFLFRVLLLWGLLFTTAAESGVITSTTPAVVGMISFFFLKEKVGPRVIVGIALSVLGIVALNVLGSDTGAVRSPALVQGHQNPFCTKSRRGAAHCYHAAKGGVVMICRVATHEQTMRLGASASG